MAKRHTADPALRQLQEELSRTSQALKDAYARFDCVCDNDLIDSCIFEINALRARSNYLLRCIKLHTGETVAPSVPHAVAVVREEEAPAPCVAAAAVKGGDLCRS